MSKTKNLRLEEPGAKPRYFPGDIVRVQENGGWGVITEAQVIINGNRIEWNNYKEGYKRALKERSGRIDHAWPPGYVLAEIPGMKKPPYLACIPRRLYEATDFNRVVFGLLHESEIDGRKRTEI
jgi:hypothetical protein